MQVSIFDVNNSLALQELNQDIINVRIHDIIWAYHFDAKDGLLMQKDMKGNCIAGWKVKSFNYS